MLHMCLYCYFNSITNRGNEKTYSEHDEIFTEDTLSPPEKEHTQSLTGNHSQFFEDPITIPDSPLPIQSVCDMH